MKRSVFLATLFLVFAAMFLPAQEATDSHYHIDGFEIFCSGGYRFLESESEDVIIIQAPYDYQIIGFVLPGEYSYHGELKELLIRSAREFVADMNMDEFSERITITFTESAFGIRGYWIGIEIEELHYISFAADVRNSPGGYAALLFLTLDDIFIPASDQEDALDDLMENFWIEFYDAAG